MKTIALLSMLIGFNYSTLKAQNDTLTICRVKYFELNIPAGWEKFYVAINDSVKIFESIEISGETLSDMLNFKLNDRKSRKLYNQLTKNSKKRKAEPFQYKEIGLLYIESYQVTGLFSATKGSVEIQSVTSFSRNTLDIGLLQYILKIFN